MNGVIGKMGAAALRTTVLLVVAAAIISRAPAAAPIDLAAADGNVLLYTAVGDNSKGMSALYAAREFRDWLLRITGREIGVTNSRTISTKRILFTIVDDPKLGDDGFRIKVETNGDVVVRGGKRGVIYGAYELIETYGGVGWFASWHTVVPKKDRFEIPGDLDIVQTPAFVWRDPSWRDVCDHAEFAVRLRMNGDGKTWHFGKELGGGLHYVRGLSAHSFNHFLPVEKYFGEHPEWYSEIGGVRRGNARFTQICLSSDAAAEESARNILAMIDADAEKPGFVTIWPNDNHMFCRCAACRASVEAEGSDAGPYLKFANRIAKKIAARYPNVLVRAAAYQNFRHAPKTVRPADNVFVEFCWYENEYAHPHETTTHPLSRRNAADFETWSKICSKAGLSVWDYVSNWNNYMRPMATLYTMKPNYEYYLRHGVKYIYSEGALYHADFAELRAWMAAKLAWNPHQDDRKLVDRFFAGYYGKAAPYIREHLESLHAAFGREPRAWQRIFCVDMPQYYTDEMLDRSFALWEKAEEAVRGDKAYEYNVRMSKFPILNTRLEREFRHNKTVWAAEDPSAIRGPAGDFGKILAEFEANMREAVAKRVKFKVGGASYGVELWKGALAFSRPAKGSRTGVADVSNIRILHGNLACVTNAPGATGGKCLRIFPVAQEHAATFYVYNLAYDKGAEYDLRIRARICERPGGKGEAVVVRIYDSTADRQHLFWTKRAEEMSGEWQWYSCGAFRPNPNMQVQLRSGRFANGGGVSAQDGLEIDLLEFTKKERTNNQPERGRNP